MPKMTFRGASEFPKELERLERAGMELFSGEPVSFLDLFTPEFMRSNTPYGSITELLEAGGFHASNNDELNQIPCRELDEFVSRCTKYPTFQSMLDEVNEEYLRRWWSR